MYQWFSLWINRQFGAYWGVVCRFRAMGYAMEQKRRFREDERGETLTKVERSRLGLSDGPVTVLSLGVRAELFNCVGKLKG